MFSGFSLGVGVSLLLCSLFFLSNSLRAAPKVAVFLPGFDRAGANSSFPSCPLSSFNTNHSSESSLKRIEEGSVVVGSSRTSEVNVSSVGPDIGDMKNSSFSPNVGNNVGNDSKTTSSKEGRHEEDLVGEKNVTVTHSDHQMEKMKVGNGFYEKCDIFDGKWVRDESKPYYPLGSCPLIDRDFDCHSNERPDSEYVKWKWQPNECNIPRYYENMINVFFINNCQVLLFM